MCVRAFTTLHTLTSCNENIAFDFQRGQVKETHLEIQKERKKKKRALIKQIKCPRSIPPFLSQAADNLSLCTGTDVDIYYSS